MSIHRLINKNFYSEEMSFYRYFLKNGDVFVDVGANIGLLSLMAAKAVAPTGSVYSFEPNPKAFRYLVENFDLNFFKEGCTQYMMALADKEVTSDLYIRKYGHDLGSLSKTTHLASKSIKVQISRGDIVLKDVPQITMLKIDVEGAEFRVIKGFEMLIDRIKFIMFEANSQFMQSHGLSSDKLIEFLESKGFKILDFKGSPIQTHCNATIPHCDLFAVRPNDIAEFLSRSSIAISMY